MKIHNYIVIFHEKHGDRHFIAPTSEDLKKIALKIVLERIEDGWYCFPEEEPKKPKFALEDTSEEDDVITHAIQQQWSNYQYKLGHYKEAMKEKALLDEILKGGEKAAEYACKFIYLRRDGQYEGFEVISPEQYEN